MSDATHTPADVEFLAAVGKGRHRRGASARLRAMVAKQERAQFGVLACFCCGVPITLRGSTLEHIRCQADGGKTVLPNLALSHPLCNTRRGSSNSPRVVAKATPP
jgi:hypothetical protein